MKNLAFIFRALYCFFGQIYYYYWHFPWLMLVRVILVLLSRRDKHFRLGRAFIGKLGSEISNFSSADYWRLLREEEPLHKKISQRKTLLMYLGNIFRRWFQNWIWEERNIVGFPNWLWGASVLQGKQNNASKYIPVRCCRGSWPANAKRHRQSNIMFVKYFTSQHILHVDIDPKNISSH